MKPKEAGAPKPSVDFSRYVGMWIAYDGAVVHASAGNHTEFLAKVSALPPAVRRRVTSFMVTEEAKAAIG